MTTSESLWQEITTVALLGAQRRPFEPPQSSGELGHLLNAPASPAAGDTAPFNDPSAGERRLLRAAALTALHYRAGRLPALQGHAFPPPAAAEQWPRCSLQAGRCLEQILSGELIVLLPEWIEVAAASQQRVREEHLPLLFSQQKTILPLRRALLPVLGERGRWLAAQNPDWCAFAPGCGEEVWTDGQRKDRLVYLEDLRAADPTLARELLAATWPQEPPAERLAFLPLLGDGLSLADEPFLEAVLEDRRKDVRQAAAALLARLPESRLVQRMTLRARACFTWRAALLRRPALEVTLPTTCDAAMLRDGIDPRPPAGSQYGEKAWVLVQVLSYVPPAAWSEAWNMSPIQLLEETRKHEWQPALLAGWKEAALRFQDARWLEDLANYEFRSGEQKRLLDFFARLPAPIKERLLLSLLREFPNLSNDQPASAYLSTCREPWGPNLTEAVTSLICDTLQHGDPQPSRWDRLLHDIAPFFNPGLLAASIERIAAALRQKETGDPSAAALLAVLEFRLTLRQAFVSDSFPETNAAPEP